MVESASKYPAEREAIRAERQTYSENILKDFEDSPDSWQLMHDEQATEYTIHLKNTDDGFISITK